MATRRALLLIHRYFERNSFGNISRARICISPKLRILNQEHMTIEVVARYGHPSGCSPDTDVFRKKFNRQYLESQNFYSSMITNFVSGSHDNRGGGTIWLHDELFFQYMGVSEEIQSGIS